MRTVSCTCAAAWLIALISTTAMAQQNIGYLKTNVNPGRAGVFVDGKYLGPAANFRVGRKYAVSAGQHEVKLVEPRYESVVKTVTVESGKTTKVVETMKALPAPKPPFGTLRTISKDKFAAVYVNGQFMGHTDEFSNSSQGLLLNPGTYTVKVEPLNGAPKEEQIKIEADKVTVFRME